MAELPINYGDTGKIARDKINDSFNALVEQVEGYEPHIVEGIWWIGETNTGVKAEGDNVQMKVEGDYIRYKTDSISWTTLILLSDLKGPQGDQGDAATITVGSTVTGAAGTSASVENVGSSSEAVLKFVIPAGAKGEPGQDGEDGEDGESATIEIGTTTTGEPGTDASVTNSGTSSAAVLNFTIPAGLKGDPGEDGEDGNGISSVTTSKSGKTTTVTMNYTSGEPTVFQVQDGADGQGSGDMSASTYDPTGKMADAFDYDNMDNTPENLSDFNNDVGFITTAPVQSVNGQTGVVSLTIPSTAADVGALPDTTKYGANLSLTINSSTYVVTAQLKDQNGNNLGTAQTIDLPLESVVVSGSYDSATKKVVLTLQSGSTIEFSVADLVSGLQSEITSSNKLDADLVDDSTSTNKFVTTSDKTTWGGKQDALTLPATPTSGHLVTWGANNKTLADGGAIPTVPTNVSAFNNDAGYTTNTGTITSVKMNGSTVSSSGEADLGTVITAVKTINSTSIVGTGNIDIESAFSGTPYTQAEYDQLEIDDPSVLTDGIWRVIYQ